MLIDLWYKKLVKVKVLLSVHDVVKTYGGVEV